MTLKIWIFDFKINFLGPRELKSEKLVIRQPCRPKLATLLVVVLENGLSEFVAPKNDTFDTKILEIGVIGKKYIW